MKQERSSIREIAIMESHILRKLNFALFSDLKEDLPKDYLITKQDIDLLAILNKFAVMSNKKTMEKILEWFGLLDKEELQALYKIHCDPYELFIDAGRIDVQLNITIKDR